MRILIAEDEQRTRQGLVRVLQSLRDEYEIVAQASNGKAALEMILEQKPDVVFIDIKMPFMDGLSVIEAARAQGIKAEFVIVSAYADFDFAKQSISLGVIEYLLKPLTRDEAEAVLKKIENKISGKNSYSRRKSRNLRDKYPDAHPMILQALDIIQSGYAGKISQKKLAEDLGLSQEYFSYLFGKNIGENFSTFLREYRIEQAQYMLREEICDQRDVPYQVGFSDSKYFKKVFRERSGITVSTIHGVKGAEFDVVIAFGLLEGMVPHFNEVNGHVAASKLLYVLSSRARKNLHLISESERQRGRYSSYSATELLAACIFNYDEE